MAKHLSDEKWLQIRTEYELGHRLRDVSIKFDVSDKTIYARAKKEGWSNKLECQVLELKEKISEIRKIASPEQYPIIQKDLDQALQLQTSINNFVIGAIDLNLVNLRAVRAEPDHEKRINMTAKMRATMADLVGVAMNRPTLPSPEGADQGKPIMINFNPVKKLNE